MRNPKNTLVALALFAATLFGGCVSREMVITSEPEGAEVLINETYRGKTPMTHKFLHYGTYGIRVEMDGYHPLYVEEKVAAPFYEKPGLDLVSEAFVPKKMNDHREFHYKLEKLEGEEDLKDVMARAKEARVKMNAVAEEEKQKELARKPRQLPLPVKKTVKAAEEAAEDNQAPAEPQAGQPVAQPYDNAAAPEPQRGK